MPNSAVKKVETSTAHAVLAEHVELRNHREEGHPGHPLTERLTRKVRAVSDSGWFAASARSAPAASRVRPWRSPPPASPRPTR